MARRLLAFRALLLRPCTPLLASPSTAISRQQALVSHLRPCSDNVGGLRIDHFRWASTSIAVLPNISDQDVLHALKRLIAEEWPEIAEDAKDAVEAALNKKTDDTDGIEQLKNAWRAAEAVEKFSGTLVSIRMALDDLSGMSGEKVRPLPPLLVEAINTALSRYKKYLASFQEDEFYLKKKVEVELGSLLVHIRQRCSGLDPEWGNISLLGTTGLSGSLIEHRTA